MISLFSRDLIITSLEASSAYEALNVLGNLLLEKGVVKPSFPAAVIEREKKFPTGLELGKYNVAIPHADTQHVLQDSIAVGILKTPVSFARMDEPTKTVEVHTIFMLALTQPHSHLSVLKELTSFLQDGESLANLISAQNAEQVYSLLTQKLRLGGEEKG
ncbi:PTS system IIA component, Gat family [Thermanaeromonas toyohensis ToBE]|uniref:PTS system IIA component, Gat family n=1 Tax=Thermanaeromonas toyohensis ToBE TaxID=698762 RepID=A0A1W1VNP6_9FIRM|nr:PTS sugar transporter subunit IIA [Thermanaeromonas toyohensis]SMB95005.1 PTS system IIA component, Gat family [Thermanaeromonas toyohensis ToBE]